MFIEKISKEKKEKYIENYVIERNFEEFPLNTLEEMEKEDGAYKKMILDDYDIKFAKEYGYDKFFEELEKENIFIRFYWYAGEDYIHRYSYQQALIFVFGDTDIKILEENVGCRAYYAECCERIKEYLERNLNKIKIDDNLEINKDYVTTFMAENVENIEKYIDYIKNIYQSKKQNFISAVEKEEATLMDKMKDYTLN